MSPLILIVIKKVVVEKPFTVTSSKQTTLVTKSNRKTKFQNFCAATTSKLKIGDPSLQRVLFFFCARWSL